MASTIKLKNGSGAPTTGDLVQGEPALDLTNKRLYTENASGVVIEVGTNPSALTIGGTALTATATELNVLDGITATTAELNYTDGVTSNIQTQLNTKAPIDGATFTGTTTIPTADINAGTIDGTVIGGSSPAAGTFTTFTSTGIDDNATSTAITIDASENVGIGTSSPSTALDVSGGTTNQVGIFRSTDATATVGFADNTTPLTGNLSYVTLGAVGNNMVFNTNLVEAMRIDSSGNVGIGTSSPTDKLHLGTSSGGTQLKIQSGSGINNCILHTNGTTDSWRTGMNLSLTDGSYEFYDDVNNVSRMVIDSSGNLLVGTTTAINDASGRGNIAINGSSSSILNFGVSGAAKSYLFQNAGNFIISNLAAAGGYLGFENNGAERMRIDSSGQLLINRTSTILASANIQIDALGNGGIAIRDVTSAGWFQRFYDSAAAQVGSITRSGSSTVYATSSDYRLKHDIQPMSGALAKVAQLKPVTYKWNADGSESHGFIAHELQEVVPECVAGEKDAVDDEGNPQYQGIDTSFLVATLTAAIQEQQAIIEELKAEVAALKGAN